MFFLITGKTPECLGDKEECGNYRPISVLSVPSKLFEKLVYRQIYSYLDENKVLTRFQSGSRKGHSTCTSLLNTTNTWLVNMDINRVKYTKTLGVLVDENVTLTLHVRKFQKQLDYSEELKTLSALKSETIIPGTSSALF